MKLKHLIRSCLPVRGVWSLAVATGCLFAIPTAVRSGPLEQAKALVGQKQYDEAIAKLQEALKGGVGDHNAVTMDLIEASIAGGRLVSSTRLCDDFLKENPPAPMKSRVMLLSAQLKEANYQLRQALSAYRTIAEMNPAVPEKADALLGAIRVARFALADEQEEARSMADFVQSFPSDPQAREIMIRLYYYYTRAGPPKKAAEMAKKYKTTYPTDPAGSAMHEFYYLHAAGEAAAVGPAWDAERASPLFVWDSNLANLAWGCLTQNPENFPRLEKFANDYHVATGDPAWLMNLAEFYEGRNIPDKAIAISTTLLQKYPGSPIGRRARLTMANAYARQIAGNLAGSESIQAEKLYKEAAGEDPTNASHNTWGTWWSRMASGEGVGDGFTKKATEVLASMAAQPNRKLKADAIHNLTYTLAWSTYARKDWAKSTQYYTDFLEKSAVGIDGAALGQVFELCFTGGAKIDAMLASVEKCLRRTGVTLNGFQAVDAAEALAKGYEKAHPAESKKILEMVARVRADEIIKQMTDLRTLRNTGKWKEAADLGETILAKLSAVAGSEQDETFAPIVIEAMMHSGQNDKGSALAKKMLEKYPAQPAIMWAGALCFERLPAPANKDAAPLYEEIRKLGYWPFTDQQVDDQLFYRYEIANAVADMQAVLQRNVTKNPHWPQIVDWQRRLGVALMRNQKMDEGMKMLEVARARSQPYGGDIVALYSMATATTNSSAVVTPLVDQYLARPNRGPAQIYALGLKGWILQMEKKDFPGAEKMLQQQAARSADAIFNPYGMPNDWVNQLTQAIVAKPDFGPDQLASLKAAVLLYGNMNNMFWYSVDAEARLDQPLEFARTLNTWTRYPGPNDGNWFNYYMNLAQKLTEAKKPELASVVLHTAVERFTGIDPKALSQGRQALLAINKKLGVGSIETIDDSLPYAALLRAAGNLRSGDPEPAWKAYENNEEMFDKNLDKLPVDYLSFVAGRLLKRSDAGSAERSEKFLRRWLIANDKVAAIADDEKAKIQYQLADVYFRTQRYDLARSEFASVSNRYPKTPEASDSQFRVAECYMQQKMYGEASKSLEKLSRARDKDSVSRSEFLLGVLAQQKGDMDEAKRRFKAVMEMAPTSDIANNLLYRLSELYGSENRYKDELLMLRSIGLIGTTSKQWHQPGTTLSVVIQDADLGVSRGQSYVPVVVTTTGGDREPVRLEAGSAGKGFFRCDLPTELGEPKPGDGKLQLMGKDVISYDYPDDFKKQFTSVNKPGVSIRIGGDAEFAMSATEIKDDKEKEQDNNTERMLSKKRKNQRQLIPGRDTRVDYRLGDQIKPGNNIYLQVIDLDRDVSGKADVINVAVEATSGSRVNAALTETGPHTGIFRATVKSTESFANVSVSDSSSGNGALQAIDGDKKTAWEGQNDGRAPKTITVDLKQNVNIGTIRWWGDANYPDKIPTAYQILVSEDMKTWKMVAATEGTAGAPKGKIAPPKEGGTLGAVITPDKVTARYVRMQVDKFNGSAPRIAEIEITDDTAKVLVPAQGGTTIAGDGSVLKLSPADKITASYQDELTLVSPGHPRVLTQSMLATYFDGKIELSGNFVLSTANSRIPEIFIKQVRRVDPGDRVIVRIVDHDFDVSDQRDKMTFTLKTPSQPGVKMEAIETEKYSGIFTKEIDIASPEKPDGIKLGPGEVMEVSYLDEQNNKPGKPTMRVAKAEGLAPSVAQVNVIETRAIPKKDKDAEERFEFPPADPKKGGIKQVAFRPPLTFEIIDPAAAKDSFSEVKAIVKTSGGISMEIICPLSIEYGGVSRKSDDPAESYGVDEALEQGRFLGQVMMELGDKNSPPTVVLDPGDLRKTVDRRLPTVERSALSGAVVNVLNLNGQDIISVTYQTVGKGGGAKAPEKPADPAAIPVKTAAEKEGEGAGHEMVAQARLITTAKVELCDSNYEKPVKVLHAGDKAFVKVDDLTADATAERDSVSVDITTQRGEKCAMVLQETLGHSGVFTGSIPIVPGEKPVPGDPKCEAWFGDKMTFTYPGKSHEGAKQPPAILEAEVVKGTDGSVFAFGKRFPTENVAIESNFRMAEAYFELFKNYRSLKQPKEADNALSEGMQILKELGREYPNKAYEARSNYLLGQFAQELKQYNEAIAYYRTIVQGHPDHPLAPEAQYKLGQCFEENKDMEAACAEYVTLAYTYPDSPMVANVIVRIADYFYDKKEYMTAADVSHKFVERFPAHEWAEKLNFRAAQCYYKAEEWDRAAKEFDAFVDLYPRSRFRADAMFWGGESYRSGGNMLQAFRHYKRTTWDYPESDAAKFSRGKLVSPEMVNLVDTDGQK